MVNFILGLKILTDHQQQVLLSTGIVTSVTCYRVFPQGSVLGSLLFIIYINDLPNGITSTIRLYADDVIIYKAIYSNDDVLELQEDLAKLSEWTVKWLMSFNLQSVNIQR